VSFNSLLGVGQRDTVKKRVENEDVKEARGVQKNNIQK
jgi:hypothetical protein